MKKRLKFVFLIAALTAGLIIACQLYWVYYNFQVSRTNFIASANYALRQSIDEYQLAQNKLPTSLQYKQPSLTFMQRTLPSQDPLALDTPSSKRRFSAEFTTVAVDEIHLREIRTLVSRLLSQQKHKPLNLDTLSRLFHQELLRNQITEQFHLSIARGSRVPVGEIAAAVNFYKDPVTIKAIAMHPQAYLLRLNLFPALISSLLILLSAGSLFYMWVIIKRQARLDTMKTDFINNISHELRTPLSILKTSNEALSSFGAAENPASLAGYLQINAGVIENMDANIERIVNFTRADLGMQEPKRELVLLQDIIQQVVTGLSIGKGGNIQVDIGDEPISVFTDRYMLGIILTNLIENAIKYANGDPEIEVRARQYPKSWQLQVSDRGPGIAAEYLPYIFDKFYRVPTGDVHEIKGYGIGLAYVKQLVGSLKGRIEVASKPGNGTTFTLFFNS
ncbi:sensor histidine kinase [Mucilaginibacter agri]|uniref:histidine kinase n=1 Tax=Mucilaginibacter agri TaxID=2695265 RepID=A0A965ZM31_9SPHI|nr:HAMP domain-containing sensor histidine kinase [Mucilaginibacter agri]NCD72434.1 hypothetical protein [Mucilaginibacter agri]